jgi:CspA family cold shock protein
MPTGKIKKWNADRGFGFIKPDAGKDDVFVHVSEFERAGLEEPKEGDAVSFEIEADRKTGKPRAVRLRRSVIGRMDRATLMAHLALADHLAKGDQVIRRQLEVTARLEAIGGDTTSARALLREFENTQASHASDRESIKAELEAGDPQS